MKGCTVSIIGQDGQTYSLDVTASSLFDAVDQAVQSWAKLWWYKPDAVIEVRAGDQHWKIRAGRVREWAARGQR
jgi:outer membrane biosynthesis protein TonB